MLGWVVVDLVAAGIAVTAARAGPWPAGPSAGWRARRGGIWDRGTPLHMGGRRCLLPTRPASRRSRSRSTRRSCGVRGYLCTSAGRYGPPHGGRGRTKMGAWRRITCC